MTMSLVSVYTMWKQKIWLLERWSELETSPVPVPRDDTGVVGRLRTGVNHEHTVDTLLTYSLTYLTPFAP